MTKILVSNQPIMSSAHEEKRGSRKRRLPYLPRLLKLLPHSYSHYPQPRWQKGGACKLGLPIFLVCLNYCLTLILITLSHDGRKEVLASWGFPILPCLLGFYRTAIVERAVPV
ncbi:hypothetical protein BGZ57DRAFT_409611 [Hyaloscypha finlandica]|nr:hypothetical protein BGZ57DRAFT_409611 [Hyaloscypha finlandica]